jgi:hypothetical protein
MRSNGELLLFSSRRGAEVEPRNPQSKDTTGKIREGRIRETIRPFYLFRFALSVLCFVTANCLLSFVFLAQQLLVEVNHCQPDPFTRYCRGPLERVESLLQQRHVSKETARMRWMLVALMVLGLAAGTGCDGDDDGQQTPEEVPENGSEIQDEEDEVAEPEILLAEGDATLGGGVGLTLCTVYPPGVGTLRGTLTWSGGPSELVAVFNDNTMAYSETEGPSPVTSVLHVSVEGEPWRFCGGNNGSTSASVHYVVTFQED